MAAARAGAPQPAFVLHQHDWSESSLILDLFTRGHGRVVAAARGAKRPYSQLRAVLLPFQRLNVALGKLPDGGEVQNLRQAEWAGGLAMPTGAALFAGFYLNELLIRLLARHDPHPALFDAYAQTLSSLGADELVVESALRAFELVLLRTTGSLPDLHLATLTQQPLRADRRYALRGEAGVIESADEATLDAAALIGLQAALEHGSLPALQQACAAALPALKQQLRALLHYHLGSSVLRTRQVMLDVQQLA